MTQFLDHVHGGSPRVAMDHSHLDVFHLLYQIADNQTLSTAIGSDQNEVLIVVEQGLYQGKIALDSGRLNDGWGGRVTEVFNLDVALFGLLDEDIPLLHAYVVVVEEEVLGVDWTLVCHGIDVLVELLTLAVVEITSKTKHATEDKLSLSFDVDQVRQSIVGNSDFSRLGDHRLCVLESPFERREEDLLQPDFELIDHGLLLLLHPRLGDAVDVDVFLGKENHTESGDCGGGGKLQIVGFEDEVDVVAEADSLTVRQREQVIVIKDGVKRFNPLRVDITVTNDPAEGLAGLFDNQTGRVCQNTVLELTRIVVHQSEELLSRH